MIIRKKKAGGPRLGRSNGGAGSLACRAFLPSCRECPAFFAGPAANGAEGGERVGRGGRGKEEPGSGRCLCVPVVPGAGAPHLGQNIEPDSSVVWQEIQTKDPTPCAAPQTGQNLSVGLIGCPQFPHDAVAAESGGGLNGILGSGVADRKPGGEFGGGKGGCIGG